MINADVRMQCAMERWVLVSQFGRWKIRKKKLSPPPSIVFGEVQQQCLSFLYTNINIPFLSQWHIASRLSLDSMLSQETAASYQRQCASLLEKCFALFIGHSTKQHTTLYDREAERKLPFFLISFRFSFVLIVNMLWAVHQKISRSFFCAITYPAWA